MVKLVGILNVTPDSFSDGGKYLRPDAAVEHGEQLLKEGASLVDIGAESTRPNAIALSPAEEWQRLEQILMALIPKFAGQISLDSHNPETIQKAYAIGPITINDVTGMNNPAMLETAARLGGRCIISHLPKVDIQTAHRDMPVKNVQEVVDDLLNRKNKLIELGLPGENIIIDPGIGFGKTPELNWQLLEFAKYVPGHSVMIGYSRKRFLGDKRMELEPNLAAAQIAIKAGADYLRVHDVAGHKKYLDKL